ncbi:hypothetical protein SAICODRAFT_22079 [Saitoella complicata NRRL Y-17804]|uniref:Uncharacterized protein n=1 Tax=Saitoella complicata (strain BCRC 22490 / CBS 7301 / JCM 7358 / NBRC 10748 / NRRL Y-17804) TaxID=698492 RepID=A0A0E9ND28_SAICN|nr:uncharacterized protein SAICODRAFT_22079 [Saitoella complicata NRRL Y-17804]ODQ49869.1 hypothetical protein SAICODRAFT_22079 [Saitoella complicata NRRL Y-17804]GAO47708.1 hypothetical protein G7K_1907-t1 [Saitoella complicata NRRL Y-17804]
MPPPVGNHPPDDENARAIKRARTSGNLLPPQGENTAHQAGQSLSPQAAGSDISDKNAEGKPKSALFQHLQKLKSAWGPTPPGLVPPGQPAPTESNRGISYRPPNHTLKIPPSQIPPSTSAFASTPPPNMGKQPTPVKTPMTTPQQQVTTRYTPNTFQPGAVQITGTSTGKRKNSPVVGYGPGAGFPPVQQAATGPKPTPRNSPLTGGTPTPVQRGTGIKDQVIQQAMQKQKKAKAPPVKQQQDVMLPPPMMHPQHPQHPQHYGMPMIDPRLMPQPGPPPPHHMMPMPMTAPPPMQRPGPPYTVRPNMSTGPVVVRPQGMYTVTPFPQRAPPAPAPRPRQAPPACSSPASGSASGKASITLRFNNTPGVFGNTPQFRVPPAATLKPGLSPATPPVAKTASVTIARPIPSAATKTQQTESAPSSPPNGPSPATTKAKPSTTKAPKEKPGSKATPPVSSKEKDPPASKIPKPASASAPSPVPIFEMPPELPDPDLESLLIKLQSSPPTTDTKQDVRYMLILMREEYQELERECGNIRTRLRDREKREKQREKEKVGGADSGSGSKLGLGLLGAPASKAEIAAMTAGQRGRPRGRPPKVGRGRGGRGVGIGRAAF